MKKTKQKNKKINVISIIVLVLLGFVGVGLIFNAVNNSTKDDKEPNEETPVVETLKLAIKDEDDESIIYTIEYVEGMTWGEWVDSDYNTLGVELIHEYLPPDYVTIVFTSISKIKNNHHGSIEPTDLINANIIHYFRASE